MDDQLKPPEEPTPPPLKPNGKPEPTKVSDLVAVQNFLAGLIREAKTDARDALAGYVRDHRTVHEAHERDVEPYIKYIDRERQKDLDWDARLRPPARAVRFVARNWRTIAPLLIALLVALGIIRGDFTVGV